MSAWRLVDLCEHVERTYGVSYSEWGLSCLLKRLNLSQGEKGDLVEYLKSL